MLRIVYSWHFLSKIFSLPFDSSLLCKKFSRKPLLFKRNQYRTTSNKNSLKIHRNFKWRQSNDSLEWMSLQKFQKTAQVLCGWEKKTTFTEKSTKFRLEKTKTITTFELKQSVSPTEQGTIHIHKNVFVFRHFDVIDKKKRWFTVNGPCIIQKWAHTFGPATIWFWVDININHEMVYGRARFRSASSIE